MYIDLCMHFFFYFFFGELNIYQNTTGKKSELEELYAFIHVNSNHSVVVWVIQIYQTLADFFQDTVLSHSVISTQYLDWLIKD